MSLYQCKVYGIVQGVGFRPFVSRLAARFGILGSVSNKGPYVEIFAQGTDAACRDFFRAIESEPPERATILRLETQALAACAAEQAYTSFSIIESARERGDIFVSPDIATCERCQAELYDPTNRRYLHPFINCTACGPRLTILEAMPYDRERTSMKDFPMCDACAAEYHSPASRRYDAQPVCCNDCGPEVFLLDAPDVRGAAAITAARRVLAEGGCIAIKGIGGFHLACDATNETAVAALRAAKHRPRKPFAVMARDLTAVHRLCTMEDAAQEVLLTGHQKPILLLAKREGSPLAPSVAPGNPRLGVILPYAPLQMLLFSYPDGLDDTMPDCLVMTSGNPSGAPICHTDEEARETLAPMTSLILTHNRRIRLRADDSVTDWHAGHPYLIRRSRGLAPLPFFVSSATGEERRQVLAIGGELKNAFTLARGALFYPSPYIGDMSDLRTVLALKDSVHLLSSLLEITPEIVACDLHPRYNTTAVAKELHLPVFPVQHHYAHILACLAEHDCPGPAIGVALDGTGYGTDGTVWGGEFLRADLAGFTRLGSIDPFVQAGGDSAAREGWRIAVACLAPVFLEGAPTEDAAWQALADCATGELHLCSAQEFAAQSFLLRRHLNSISSTSTGRLFDAVSALLGLTSRATFEGEAAMALQFAAERFAATGAPPLAIDLPPLAAAPDGRFLLPTQALFRALFTRRRAGGSAEALACAFHAALAALIGAGCEEARRRTGLSTVALSGGVFQNLLLLRLTEERLENAGFTVLTHSLVPPNDGGISLGQAVAAMYALTHGTAAGVPSA